jgi:signal transduction histidine kinase
LSNAFRYAKKNEGLALDKDGSYARLSVFNPAPQLRAEDLGHLFERFYTADKSRSSSGSGLGLSVVKKLTEEMGGKITDVSLSQHILKIKIGFPLCQK